MPLVPVRVREGGPSSSPIGILVPYGGSSCSTCMYVARDGMSCVNRDYVAAEYRGKAPGEDRFVDGKSGRIVEDPREFCCNFFDWTPE